MITAGHMKVSSNNDMGTNTYVMHPAPLYRNSYLRRVCEIVMWSTRTTGILQLYMLCFLFMIHQQDNTSTQIFFL